MIVLIMSFTTAKTKKNSLKLKKKHLILKKARKTNEFNIFSQSYYDTEAVINI